MSDISSATTASGEANVKEENKPQPPQPSSNPAPHEVLFTGIWQAQMTGFKGLFKMLPTAVGWQPSKQALQKHHATYSPVTFAHPATDVTDMRWIQVTQNLAQLTISLKGAAEYRFCGFPAKDEQRFEEFVKAHLPHVNFSVEKAALSGHNWGEVSFTRSSLAFEPAEGGDDKSGGIAFEIPCSAISQCVIPMASKNELSIEFFTDKPDNLTSCVCDGDHQLVGLRFYMGAKDEGAARSLQKKLVERAQIGDLTGKGITMLSGLQFLTPRGRYDMELFPQFLTLHGVSFDFRIQYSQIVKLTALDKPNSYTDLPAGSGSSAPRSVSEYYFVISLEPQLHQGKQTYAHLVLIVDNQKKVNIKAKLTPEVAEKWPSLKRDMESTMFGHIGTLLCTVTKRNLTTTGSFCTSQGMRFIKCASRSYDGSLYLLEAAMMFVPRPPVLIRYDDINRIELDRISTMDRTFDITVVLRNNSKQHFTSIQRRDYNDFSDFLLKKGIKLVRKDDDAGGLSTRISSAQEGDDDMSSSDEEYDDKEEAKKRRAENGEGNGGDDDEEDEDYEDDDDDDDDEDYDQDISEDELKAIGSTATGGSVEPSAKRSKKSISDEKKKKEDKKKGDDDESKDKGKEKKHKHHHHHHKHKHKHDKSKDKGKEKKDK